MRGDIEEFNKFMAAYYFEWCPSCIAAVSPQLRNDYNTCPVCGDETTEEYFSKYK